MRIANEFHVAAPLATTWDTLLDIERVASCLPGAVIEGADGSGAYRGRFKVKLGAVTSEYTGTAKLLETDDDDNVAVFVVRGSEVGGLGSASATITNRLARTDGDGTTVSVETDLDVTGRAAQFGRGLMNDVAGAVLSQFAERLETLVLAPNGAQATGEVAAGRSDDPGTQPDGQSASPRNAPDGGEALELGGVMWKPIARRAAPVLGAGIALVAAAAVLRLPRRRRGITLRVDL